MSQTATCEFVDSSTLDDLSDVHINLPVSRSPSPLRRPGVPRLFIVLIGLALATALASPAEAGDTSVWPCAAGAQLVGCENRMMVDFQGTVRTQGGGWDLLTAFQPAESESVFVDAFESGDMSEWLVFGRTGGPPPPPPDSAIPNVPFDYLMAAGPPTSTSSLPNSVGAGEVVALQNTDLGDRDHSITCSGTDGAPAFIVGGTISGDGNGSVVNIGGTHCHFIGTTFVNAQPRTSGSRHVLSGIDVSENGKNCANIGGTEVVVTNSEFHHCRPTGRDAHGIQISVGAREIWILDSKSHNNAGNGFQATHCSSGCQSTRPSGIYLRGNEFYENREGNGLKWADNVIFESNTFHTYRASSKNVEWCFSDGFCATWDSGSDGSAIVIGADNEPEGLTNVLVVNNLIYNTSQGLRVEDAMAPVIEGNIIRDFGGRCLALDKYGEGIVFRRNTCERGERGISQNWRDNFSLDVDANTFDVSGVDIEYEARNVCEASTLTNNTFVNGATVICGNESQTSEAGINSLPGASGNTVQ